MHLFILADVAGGITEFGLSVLEKVGSPALVLLILGLSVAIVYFKNKLAEKELQIKELNKTLLDSTISNLQVIHEIELSIDKRDEKNLRIENLLMDNNSHLKAISRSLNI